MQMQAESLDVLEKADVAPAQARAIVRAIEIEIAGASNTLATKQDLSEFRAETVRQFSALRVEIAGQLSELRGELHRSISGVTRQMYMAILSQMAVLLGFAYFFATHLR